MISTEFRGAIISEFSFTYSPGGATAMPFEMGDRLATVNMGRKGVVPFSGRLPPMVDFLVFARWRQCAVEDTGTD